MQSVTLLPCVSKFCETSETLADVSVGFALDPVRTMACSAPQPSQAKVAKPSSSAKLSSAFRFRKSSLIRRAAKRRSTDDAYQRRLEFAKQRAVVYRATKAARRAKEKERQPLRLVGILWGYDPSAGLVAGEAYKDEDFPGCYMFTGHSCDVQDYGPEEIDSMDRRTGRRWCQGSKWGIEFGGPGQVPEFEASQYRQLL